MTPSLHTDSLLDCKKAEGFLLRKAALAVILCRGCPAGMVCGKSLEVEGSLTDFPRAWDVAVSEKYDFTYQALKDSYYLMLERIRMLLYPFL